MGEAAHARQFAYAAHAAFFAGFLPTPARPGRHPRPFAVRFPGNETTTADTLVFDAPDIVTGFRGRGHHAICVGGVGFFNKQSPLGTVFPNLFDESHWSPELGVTDPRSTGHQVNLALDRIAAVPTHRRVFLFLNVSAIHQPNRLYLAGAEEDSPDTHAAALEYADGRQDAGEGKSVGPRERIEQGAEGRRWALGHEDLRVERASEVDYRSLEPASHTYPYLAIPVACLGSDIRPCRCTCTCRSARCGAGSATCSPRRTRPAA